jgi:hypothetical protein
VARCARVLLYSAPLFGEEGAGKAGCRLAPTVRCAKAHAEKLHSGIQVKPNTRPSLRSGLTAYACSPRSRVPSGLRHLANWRCREARLSLKASPQGLTVATTVRTTRFCRTQQSGFTQRASPDTGAVRPHAVKDLTRFISPWPRLGMPDAAASTAPPPTFRDDVRSSLSSGRDGWENAAIPNFGKVEYFYGRGLMRFCMGRVFCPTGKNCSDPISALLRRLSLEPVRATNE